jgi:mannose/fructose/N-acetylgalactosamine-specific phosphotransferase system component IID
MLYNVFKYTLVAVIVFASVMTAMHAFHSETVSHLNTIMPWFAGVEAVAALLLLVSKVKKVAAVVLLVVFAIAIVVHGPLDGLFLFVYAAGALLIGFSGPRR